MSEARLRGSRGRATRSAVKGEGKRKTYKESDISSSESEKDNSPVLLGRSSRTNLKNTASKTKTSKQKKGNNSSANSNSDGDARSSKRKRGVSSRKAKRSRQRVIASEEESESEDGEESEEKTLSDSDSAGSDKVSKTKRRKSSRKQKKKQTSGRRDIKKILKDEDLQEETREAERKERERLQRLKKREKEQRGEVAEESPEKKPVASVVLQKNPLVEVSPFMAQNLRPHQVEGVRFLWNNLIESTHMAKTGQGAGCILAHCMGLGKTLQTIACVHTILKCTHLSFERVLVVAPLNTVRNWIAEFVMWCEDGDELELYNFAEAKTNKARVHMLRQWNRIGGVLILGYEMYRIMTTRIRYSNWRKTAQETLIDPGPDIVVCDEGHMLKNAESYISKQLNKIKTRRRLALTGTPLQNNLVEYHCMVNFVKPDLLGSLKEFRNRFVHPILNGQHIDSTDHDVKIMKKRSHVLHQMLEGFVQRKDYTALKPYLSSKFEYVLKVRLTPLQIKLYQHYLDTMTNRGANSSVVNKDRKGASLFADYQNLMRVWTHPKSLLLHTVKKEKLLEKRFLVESDEASMTESDEDWVCSSGDEGKGENANGEVSEDKNRNSDNAKKNEIDLDTTDSEGVPSASPKKKTRKKVVIKCSSSEGESNAENGVEENGEPDSSEDSESTDEEYKKDAEKLPHRRTRSRGNNRRYRLRCEESSNEEDEEVTEQEIPDWYTELLPKDKQLLEDYRNSSKIAILFEILRRAEERNEKVLVFSQSLISLDLIEEMLDFAPPPNSYEKVPDETSDEPHSEPCRRWYKNIDYFRMDGATQGHHRQRFINAFNDEDDTRSRLFLISTRAGSLGVNLIGANRVVIFDASWNPSHDTQSMFRVYRLGQQRKCYIYRLIADGTMEEKIYQRQVNKQSLAFRVVDEQQINRHFTANSLAEMYAFNPTTPDATKDEPTPIVPKDEILAEILSDPRTRHMVASYHEHDSLLDHQVDEELTEEERKAAWEEYEMVKRGQDPRIANQSMPFGYPSMQNVQQATFTTGALSMHAINEMSTLLSRLSKMLANASYQYQVCEVKSVDTIMKHLKETPLYSNSNEATIKAIAKEVHYRLELQKSERLRNYQMLQKQFRDLQAQYFKAVSDNVKHASMPNQMPQKSDLFQQLSSASGTSTATMTPPLTIPSQAVLLQQLARRLDHGVFNSFAKFNGTSVNPNSSATSVTTISEVIEIDDDKEGTSEIRDA